MSDLPHPVTDLVLPEWEGGYAKGRETRELILRTALTLLIESGYPAMSMRRIAAASGLSFGNVTYHYPSREELVRELLDAVIRSYEVEFDALVRTPGVVPREQLRRYCLLIFEDIRSKKTTRLFPELWALSNHDAFARERVQELYARARAPLIRIVGEMRPDLTPDTHETIALFISSAMEGTTPFAGYEKPFRDRMPAIAEIAIQAFIALVETYQVPA